MEEVNREMMKQFPIENMKETPFVFPKNPEPVLKQMVFLLNVLINLGYTLSVICPADFAFRDKVLFLKRDTHLLFLKDGHYIYKQHGKSKCFVPDGLQEGPTSLATTYASVGLFAYYLWTRKKKSVLYEADFGKLKGTKVYYFIKNTQEKNPILLYL